jgi:alkyl hydroperoxide reductase subunit AhpF
MGLITPADQERLREAFTEMTRPVRLLFFTQTLGCETCLQTKEILAELPPLSDRIAIEEVNFILEPDKARQYGIDHVPAIAVAYHEKDTPEVLNDSRIRFVGTPAGYEFASLVRAVLLAGGGESSLTPRSRGRLALVDKPVTMQVFTTPT